MSGFQEPSLIKLCFQGDDSDGRRFPALEINQSQTQSMGGSSIEGRAWPRNGLPYYNDIRTKTYTKSIALGTHGSFDRFIALLNQLARSIGEQIFRTSTSKEAPSLTTKFRVYFRTDVMQKTVGSHAISQLCQMLRASWPLTRWDTQSRSPILHGDSREGDAPSFFSSYAIQRDD